jgi:hypothetical protein
MATQRELIYSVKNILRGGQITDDDSITDRQVAFLIDAARATLLRQQYNKGQNLSDNNIQTVPCMGVEQVDTSLMPGFPSNCTVYKTSNPLPKPIESKGKDLITGISAPIIGGLTYEYIPYARLPYATFTRFKRPMVTIFNKYLYLIDAPYTLNIAVSGVFENPNELSEYNDCEGQPCFDWDTDYPMSSHLVEAAVKMVADMLTFSIRTLADRTNTGAHELESQLNSNIGGKFGSAQSSSKSSS